MLTQHSGSYYEEFRRSKAAAPSARAGTPGSTTCVGPEGIQMDRLLTDRSAYVSFLEVQLERVSAACLTAQSYSDRIEEVRAGLLSYDEKLNNLARSVRNSDSSAEIKINTFQDNTRVIQERLDGINAELRAMQVKSKSASEQVSDLNENMGQFETKIIQIAESLKRRLEQQVLDFTSRAELIDARTRSNESKINGISDLIRAETKGVVDIAHQQVEVKLSSLGERNEMRMSALEARLSNALEHWKTNNDIPSMFQDTRDSRDLRDASPGTATSDAFEDEVREEIQKLRSEMDHESREEREELILQTVTDLNAKVEQLFLDTHELKTKKIPHDIPIIASLESKVNDLGSRLEESCREKCALQKELEVIKEKQQSQEQQLALLFTRLGEEGEMTKSLPRAFASVQQPKRDILSPDQVEDDEDRTSHPGTDVSQDSFSLNQNFRRHEDERREGPDESPSLRPLCSDASSAGPTQRQVPPQRLHFSSEAVSVEQLNSAIEAAVHNQNAMVRTMMSSVEEKLQKQSVLVQESMGKVESFMEIYNVARAELEVRLEQGRKHQARLSKLLGESSTLTRVGVELEEKRAEDSSSKKGRQAEKTERRPSARSSHPSSRVSSSSIKKKKKKGSSSTRKELAETTCVSQEKDVVLGGSLRENLHEDLHERLTLSSVARRTRSKTPPTKACINSRLASEDGYLSSEMGPRSGGVGGGGKRGRNAEQQITSSPLQDVLGESKFSMPEAEALTPAAVHTSVAVGRPAWNSGPGSNKSAQPDQVPGEEKGSSQIRSSSIAERRAKLKELYQDLSSN